MDAAPFIVIIIIALAIFAVFRTAAERLTICFISLWLAFEAVIGIRQVLGMEHSHHFLYSITGSFANPGPYGGFVAVCTSVVWAYVLLHFGASVRFERCVSCLAAIAGCLGVVVLPASLSRAGWMGFLAAGVGFICSRKVAKEWLRSHHWIIPVAIAVIVVLLAVSFNLKRDSALGRLHIWEMELRAIAERPFSGYGPGNSLGAYGEAQAEYFESAERSPQRVRIAGCPEYAFNEYLRFGLEYGILGALGFLAVIVLAAFTFYRLRSSLTWGLIAWGVFAFSSYPLSVWQTKLLLAVFLGAAAGSLMHICGRGKWIMTVGTICICIPLICLWYEKYNIRRDAECRWQEERRIAGSGYYDISAECFSDLYPILKNDFRFLYDFGYALHKAGKYSESTRILEAGARMSSDPVFQIIIGKNYESEGHYDDAEKTWLYAHYMVPSRLYPYILLMEMYDSLGDKSKATYYAKKAAALPVNEKNKTMCELHEKAECYLSR